MHSFVAPRAMLQLDSASLHLADGLSPYKSKIKNMHPRT